MAAASRSGIPSVSTVMPVSPPSRTCDRVLRFAPEPVYAGVTGCLASRSTTFSSDRPATGRVVFLVCGVWGWRPSAQPLQPPP